MKKLPIVVHKVTIRNGGATDPTVEFYQLKSGRCRLWWYCYDQDGGESGTLAVFKTGTSEDDWQKAISRAVNITNDIIKRGKPK